MAFTITANYEPATDGQAIWKLKELLVAAGYSVRSSGTGTGAVYNASGDAHSPGGPYGGTLDLGTAWFELRAPAGMTPRRSWLFFRVSTSHGQWRVLYSSDGTGFTGGSPNATTPPTAADSQGVFNSPSGTNDMFGSQIANATFRCDYVIGAVGEGYSWLMTARKIGFNYCAMLLGFDSLLDAASLDQDPAVVFLGGALGSDSQLGCCDDTTGLWSSTDTQGGSCCHAWFKKGLTGATYVQMPFGAMGALNGSSTYSTVGSSNAPGMDDQGRMPSFPLTYRRAGSVYATQKGWKGRSRLFRSEMQRLGVRPYGDKTRWILGGLSIPWDGATEMVL